MRHLWPWILAALSGLLMALAFPPVELGSLAWVALTPLIVAVWFGCTDGRWRVLRLFGLGYLTGLVFFWAAFFWLTEVTGLGWFLLAFYLAIYPALWALFAGLVCRPRRESDDTAPGVEWTRSFNNLRLAFRAAAAWVGLEWVRGTLFTGFGWNQLGVALWKNTALIQIADITGVGGITFLVVLANLMLVISVKRLSVEAGRMRLRPHYDFSLTIVLIAATFCYGVSRLSRDPGTTAPFSFAAVQANIPQHEKWDPAFEQNILDTYQRLSEIAIARRPDLLIWPEAALPRPLLTDDEMKKFVTGILAKHGSDILLGTENYNYAGGFNAAVMLDAAGGVQLYHKMHLVPFGEFIPFRHSFPLFAWVVGDQVPGDFEAGTEAVVMMTQGRKKHFRFAPLICFEDTVGELVRQFADKGAEILITLTNDGWFRESSGSRQHMINAIFRSVETKLPLVRAANTGVTCSVDPWGRVREILQTPDGNTFIEGFLYDEFDVTVQPQKTFYTRYGDLFSIACFFGALLSIRTHLVTARRRDLSEN